MAKEYVPGDLVEVIGGKYKPKRANERLLGRVVALAGNKMVTVALKTKGKPIVTIALTSVVLSVVAREPPQAVTAVTCLTREPARAVTCHARRSADKTNVKCVECERLKRQVEVLTTAMIAMSKICSS